MRPKSSPTRWRDPDRVLRRATAEILEAGKGFRRIPGFHRLQALAVALGCATSGKPVDRNSKAA